MKTQIAEQDVTPQLLKKIAPDVVSSQGQEKLMAKTMQAAKMKDMLETALKLAAKEIGGEITSRIKTIDTMKRKIAQKRLSGRDYDISDINDAYGARWIIDKSKIGKAKEEIRNMAKAGLFKIKKEQDVKDNEYHGYHFDIETLDSSKGELQVHHPQSALEATSNHTLRYDYGDMPKGHIVSKLKHEQRERAYDTPNDEALAKTHLIQSLEKQQGGKTTPMQTAMVLALQAHK